MEYHEGGEFSLRAFSAVPENLRVKRKKNPRPPGLPGTECHLVEDLLYMISSAFISSALENLKRAGIPCQPRLFQSARAKSQPASRAHE